MLAKRIIPCLDVRDGKVVKGVQFRNHEIVGEIVDLAARYANEGADELVFYDITASTQDRSVDKSWISLVASKINIPFCVAGGIKTIEHARMMLAHGADKISVNSPALSDPSLISRLQDEFGRQCVVIGVDSYFDTATQSYHVKQFTGDETTTKVTNWYTQDWIEKVQKLGCGEIVLNTMNQDGVRQGYDITQLKIMRKICNVPLIASGGAGIMEHFYEVFSQTNVDGALAASVFHKQLIEIKALKTFLREQNVISRD